MQQRDNKYTIMAKLFFPDQTDSQYMHSVRNAMNLLESRAALRVMRRWETSRDNLEIRPADVIMMDGPVTPQDRDSKHYAQYGSYGRIVRDLLEVNYEILQKSRDNGQVVAGVVKNSPLRVLGPLLNRFIAKTISSSGEPTQIQAWPLRSMNAMTDRAILTRLLTAGRSKDAPWFRTCIVARPFHAATDLAEDYSRDGGKRAASIILDRARAMQQRDAAGFTVGELEFWKNFRGEHDPYVKMLDNAWYAYFHLGAVPRLDQKQALPRMEVLVAASTAEVGEKHHLGLPARPDLVFVGRRKIVFVHGCFWHGHHCSRSRLPKSNVAYWKQKIATNRSRDERVRRSLRRQGWGVLTVLGVPRQTLRSDAEAVDCISSAVGGLATAPGLFRTN